MCFAFDGCYKFARYYAPAALNTPQTLDQIFQYNDVQLFDLKQDPQELHNLALDRERNKDLDSADEHTAQRADNERGRQA